MKRKGELSDGSGRSKKAIAGEAYSRVFEKVFETILAENHQLDRQRSVAPVQLTELENLTPSQRQLLIRNSAQFQAWPLVEEALARSRTYFSEDVHRAESLALLALEISDTIATEGFRARLLSDMRAEGWSYVGNCQRIRSDFHSARKAFAVAEDCLAGGTGDPLERARFLDLKASFLRAQRELKAASDCLSEAVRLYGLLPDRHAQGRVLLNQAKLVGDSGDPEQAIRILEHAERLIDHQREPRLHFLLKWSFVVYLREAGRLEEAQSLLAVVRDLSRVHGTRYDRLRLLWVEGVLRRKLGQIELAAEALSQVREGFIAAGIAFDVALVSLDLAALYLDAGKNDEVRRLAVETVPIFASLNVQRELLVAWNLFKEAAEKEVATLLLVDSIATRIRDSAIVSSDGAS